MEEGRIKAVSVLDSDSQTGKKEIGVGVSASHVEFPDGTNLEQNLGNIYPLVKGNVAERLALLEENKMSKTGGKFTGNLDFVNSNLNGVYKDIGNVSSDSWSIKREGDATFVNLNINKNIFLKGLEITKEKMLELFAGPQWENEE